MRNDLLAAVKDVPKKPPVIPPPAKPKPEPPLVQINDKPQRDSEIVYLLKVIPEYRISRSRIILEAVNANDKNIMPKIKLRPGMYVKLTNMSETCEQTKARLKQEKELRNAKK